MSTFIENLGDEDAKKLISKLLTSISTFFSFDKFLLVWIDKIYTALKKNGILALNINQFRNQNYVYWLLNDMNKNKNNYWKYLGIISHSAISKRNPQPTFIWTKI